MPKLALEKLETAKWDRVCALVEEIIGARIVVRNQETARGSTVLVTQLKRPFRFREFATEIKTDNALAYRWIRGGIEPKDKRAILDWCRKHYHFIQPAIKP